MEEENKTTEDIKEELNDVVEEQPIEQDENKEINEEQPVSEKIEESELLEESFEPKVEESIPQNNDMNFEQDKSEEPEKKSSKKGLFIFLVILVIAGIACGVWYSQNKKPEKPTSTETKADEKQASYKMSGNGLENFDLYFMKLENEAKNKVYSPLSIKYALEMIAEGANGDTKKQLDDVIGNYKSKKYTNNKNMSFANAMFIRDSFKSSVKQEYIDKLKNNYNAEVVYDSFKDASTLNKWVSNKTFGLVKDIMSDEDIKTLQFVLANALAIDMEWVNKIQEFYISDFSHEKFEPIYIMPPVFNEKTDENSIKFNNKTVYALEIAATANKYNIVKTLGADKIRETVKAEYKKWSAENGDGDIKDIDKYIDEYIQEIDKNYNKVSGSTDFSFYDDDTVKMFAKDLKTYDGTTLQYVGIMPKQDTLANYIKNTDATKLNSLISGLKEIKSDSFEEGYLTVIKGMIPVFNFEYSLALKEDLEKLGITNAFDVDKADLSNLTTSKGIFIERAEHKANIEFSNDGIKAGAASLGGGAGDIGGFDYLFEIPIKTIDLTFNNPYMFIVRDKNSGEVWFTGTVYEPSDNPTLLPAPDYNLD